MPGGGCLLRASGWGQGQLRVVHPVRCLSSTTRFSEHIGISHIPAFSRGTLWLEAEGLVHLVTSRPTQPGRRLIRGHFLTYPSTNSFLILVFFCCLPRHPRSSNLPQRGLDCVLWPPTWPRRPSPSRASSTWWTVGRSRSGTMTGSPACPPSGSPGCPRPPLISGRAVQAARSLATATGALPQGPLVMLTPAAVATRHGEEGSCVLLETVLGVLYEPFLLAFRCSRCSFVLLPKPCAKLLCFSFVFFEC